MEVIHLDYKRLQLLDIMSTTRKVEVGIEQTFLFSPPGLRSLSLTPFKRPPSGSISISTKSDLVVGEALILEGRSRFFNSRYVFRRCLSVPSVCLRSKRPSLTKKSHFFLDGATIIQIIFNVHKHLSTYTRSSRLHQT